MRLRQARKVLKRSLVIGWHWHRKETVHRAKSRLRRMDRIKIHTPWMRWQDKPVTENGRRFGQVAWMSAIGGAADVAMGHQYYGIAFPTLLVNGLNAQQVIQRIQDKYPLPWRTS